MNVRELITELLEHDLEANFEIGVKTDQEDVDIDDPRFEAFGDYLTFEANLKDYVLVDKSDFENSQGLIEELKSRIEELEEKIND